MTAAWSCHRTPPRQASWRYNIRQMHIQHPRYHHKFTTFFHFPLVESTVCTDQSHISTPPRTPQTSALSISRHHFTLQHARLVYFPLFIQPISAPIQNAAFLDNRHPLWRLQRYDRRLWSPRPQATHRGSGAPCELGDCGSVSGTSSLPFNFTPELLIRMRIAHTLRRPDLHRRRRTAEYACYGIVHGGHDYVLREYISACAGSAEVQVFGSGYAVGGIVFDWGVGCVGCEGTAGWV
jgi:hypothetical protein